MSYVSLDKNSDIILLEQQIDGGMTSPIGELLFSFLDLDLREYGDLYYLISYENDFNYNDFKDLCLTYPKTYTEMSKHHRGLPTENSRLMIHSVALLSIFSQKIKILFQISMNILFFHSVHL